MYGDIDEEPTVPPAPPRQTLQDRLSALDRLHADGTLTAAERNSARGWVLQLAAERPA